MPLALATIADAHQPARKTSAAAMASPGGPQKVSITQAKGSAASDPQLPGVTGRRPAPNQVARRTAGCHGGSPKRPAPGEVMSRPQLFRSS